MKDDRARQREEIANRVRIASWEFVTWVRTLEIALRYGPIVPIAYFFSPGPLCWLKFLGYEQFHWDFYLPLLWTGYSWYEIIPQGFLDFYSEWNQWWFEFWLFVVLKYWTRPPRQGIRLRSREARRRQPRWRRPRLWQSIKSRASAES